MSGRILFLLLAILGLWLILSPGGRRVIRMLVEAARGG